ncbi:Uma2 family endonuclease [Microcystis sp. LEGE 00066]|nr:MULTISPECIES: Uma2 family endonuclease [Microcystis]TRT96416.1 MAG: Uma2 family endonuclease [Microcystis aeruginosa Ma_AC_P_19900807_S300]TRU42059.1 MAG: Uma2 family endonuclease [Microcystis aeruginosa Ma_MB_F_20061100_S20]MBE9264216.1 Uma2 family endonuclease [Microcystis sp. LEGE 00066]UGS11243.1 Uma2 family endonuclease [Microcystis aeruginosa FACHB-905 = DIANCHI905]WKX62392.1 Uma2 family endonuclease [Microcystis aeruginosa PCC 7806]
MMTVVEIKFESWQLSDEQFFQLCQDNRDLRLERSAKGDLIIMPPTGGETGNSNAGITAQLWLWNNLHKLGVVFDSSTGFKLPNGADRSPDAAWIPLEKWQALTPQQKERFLPLSPDFVIELMSPSDSLETARKKMQEYLDNGTCLGWLINRKTREVEIYRQGQAVEILTNPESLSGESILSEFSLNLTLIW